MNIKVISHTFTLLNPHTFTLYSKHNPIYIILFLKQIILKLNPLYLNNITLLPLHVFYKLSFIKYVFTYQLSITTTNLS